MAQRVERDESSITSRAPNAMETFTPMRVWVFSLLELPINQLSSCQVEYLERFADSFILIAGNFQREIQFPCKAFFHPLQRRKNIIIEGKRHYEISMQNCTRCLYLNSTHRVSRESRASSRGLRQEINLHERCENAASRSRQRVL